MPYTPHLRQNPACPLPDPLWCPRPPPTSSDRNTEPSQPLLRSPPSSQSPRTHDSTSDTSPPPPSPPQLLLGTQHHRLDDGNKHLACSPARMASRNLAQRSRPHGFRPQPSSLVTSLLPTWKTGPTHDKFPQTSELLSMLLPPLQRFSTKSKYSSSEAQLKRPLLQKALGARGRWWAQESGSHAQGP